MSDDDIQDAAREMYENMCADLLDMGEDPYVEYVMYIETSEGCASILERGSLLKCINASLDMMSEDGEFQFQLTPTSEFAKNTESKVTMH